MDILFLVGGLALLLYSGKFLVRGGVELARHFHLSSLVVGVTVVSFGTSAPELLVSVQAAIGGYPDIAMGNVVGSNISNISIVLAIAAIICPVVINKSSLILDWPVMMVFTIILYFLILNGTLGFWGGLTIFIMLIFYVNWSIISSRLKSRRNAEKFLSPSIPLYLAIIMIVISTAGLAFGADWLVEGAAGIARALGVSERVISLSLIAFGTSLPELVTSSIAAVKKEADISVGNIIGSNIFNIGAVLGITSMIKPLTINQQVIDFDIFWVAGTGVALVLVSLPFKRPRLGRIGGFLLILIYMLYLYLIFTRE